MYAIPIVTDNSMVMAMGWGAEAGWRWEKLRKKIGTYVIVSKIKIQTPEVSLVKIVL